METKIYSREVTYTGLRGGEKTKVLNFVMTKANILENRAVFDEFKEYQGEIDAYAKKHGDEGYLSPEQALRILDLGLHVIKVAYAEVDLEDDVIDKSEYVVNRFLNSLAYEALLTEISEKPEVLIEIMNGIIAVIPVDDEQRKELTELQQQYVNKTKIQNGDNSGQDVGITLSPEEVEANELRARLAVLEGENQ